MNITHRTRLVYIVTICLLYIFFITVSAPLRGQAETDDGVDQSGQDQVQQEEGQQQAEEEAVEGDGVGQPLPSGHPDISKMMEEQAGAPVIDPSVTGRLAIQAVQGTKDGAKVGGEKIVTEFYHQNQLIHQVETQLDEFGVVVIEDIPLAGGVRALAKLEYAGVTYYKLSNTEMTATKPDMTMEVTVYELTEEEPDWYVTKRDAVLHKSDNGVSVREMIKVINPSDKTWFGIPDGSDKGDAFNVYLPSKAKNVLLIEGFHGWCCTKFIEGEGHLINQMPMMPGESQYGFGYDLDAEAGQISFDAISPARSEKTVIYALSDNVDIKATGVDSENVQTMGNSDYRYYVIENMVKGQKANLHLTGYTTVADIEEAVAKSNPAKLIAGIGVSLFVIIAIILIIIKSPKPADVS